MKKTFLVVLAATVWVGCSEGAIDNPVLDNENVEITLHSNTIDVSNGMTRAPFEGAIGTTNKLTARVIGSTVPSFASSHVDGTMIFNGGAASYDAGATGNTTFPSEAPVYLFGLHPATGWAKGVNDGVQSFVFTGKEDVMATNRIETEKQHVVDGTYKTLSFKHLLTKLEVKMYGASSAIDIFGEVSSIRLVKDATGTGVIPNEMNVVNNNATYTTPAVITTRTNAVESLGFYTLDLDAEGNKVYADTEVAAFALTTDPTLVGYSLVAPVTATNAAGSNEYFLEINTVKEGKQYVGVDLMAKGGVNAFNGATAGRSFSISVYFKSVSNIMATTEVIDWIEESESSGEVIKELFTY